MAELATSNSEGVMINNTNEISIQVDSSNLVDFFIKSQLRYSKVAKSKESKHIFSKHSCDNTNSSRRFKHQAHTNSLIPQELLQHPILPKTRKNTIAQSSQNPKPTRSKSNDLKSYHNPSSHRLTEIESLHIRSTNQPFRLLTRRVNDKPHYAYILPSVIDPLINLSSKILQKPQFAKLPKTKEYKKYPLSLYKKSKHKHIENTKSRLIDLALLNKKIFGL